MVEKQLIIFLYCTKLLDLGPLSTIEWELGRSVRPCTNEYNRTTEQKVLVQHLMFWVNT